jgi:D-sedoheptulose 7-phosphate isomerase
MSSDRKYIDTFFDGLETIIKTISREDIEKVIEALFQCWQRRGRVFLIGNGGSAGTASHFAADLNKCTIVPEQPRMRAVSLVDNVPLLSAITNDDGWEYVFVEQLENFFESGDVVLALSVHGGSGSDRAGPWSQNLLKALKFATDRGGIAIGFSGFDGGPMKEIADICVVVPFKTTPHVEAFHVALHHLICFRLQEKIKEAATSEPA